ncbi:MAG TPA: antitoxin Xre/MbcA/ParS toxin-binding domain-containing protein [Trebonia sp.]|jgi:putative toxin-antitoxin system antitoxin component (TIGR02293 family)|nr:antitoxin Xre/MbcA/ParS toxin-binding domain-containing protein [Trebonia sp.]
MPIAAAVDRVLSGGLVDTADVARVLDTSQRSVQRWTVRDSAPRKDSEERLLELAAVLDLATKILPGEGARLWLRSPVAELEWSKPLDVIKDGGFRKVIDVLLALSEGVIQ